VTRTLKNRTTRHCFPRGNLHAHLTHLESTLTEVTENKGLYLPLESTLTQKLGGGAPIARAAPPRPLQMQKPAESPFFRVLDVRVDAVQIDDVVEQMEEWIRKRRGCHSIAATGMNGIVEAQHDPKFQKILNATDLIVPDGMPLVWLGRRRGHNLPRRVYGPDLLLAFCEKTAGRGYRHFFYGAERDPDVAKRLAKKIEQRFPGTIVAGTYSQRANAEQDNGDDTVSLISRAAPDVLWVGLGELRQVRWMHEHRNKLNVPVVVGVGAAFDMISGRRRQAPRWMREHGLECLFRLLQEPRRLWRRYLIYGTEFVTRIVLASMGLTNSRQTRMTLNSSRTHFPKS